MFSQAMVKTLLPMTAVMSDSVVYMLHVLKYLHIVFCAKFSFPIVYVDIY
jgi:hypothetical protein